MSDHLSSQRALRDPVVDLTDLYAFPTPGADGRLTLIMNVFPGAQAGAAFSDAVAYRFRLRTATVRPGDHPLTRFEAAEHSVTVTFSDLDGTGGTDGSRQTATFLTSGGSARTVVVGEPDDAGGDLRVFAGLRMDPFFMDVPAEVRTRRTRELAFRPVGTNSVEGQNALSVIVDCDVRAVLGDGVGPVVAVVAETTTLGRPMSRFERKGRPEMKNFMLSQNGNDPANPELDLRDLYNLEDAFALGDTYLAAFRARIDANLDLFNSLDPRKDSGLKVNGRYPLTDLLLDDFLVVDLSKPYSEDGFLEIELAALEGRTHVSCGGRTPNHDVIDALYTLIVNGIGGEAVSDGVDRATVPATTTFPYLAPPNHHPPVADPGVPMGGRPERSA
ncbi:DUF4331 family protein [Streptomyces polygonati]|uniref:DUF4331 family protein n=1 Tax=Streptomyces polygonati TaxID=1617087 RepID=A0ABV8HZS7_9ACTN